MVSQSVSTNPDVCLNVGEPLPLSPLVTAGHIGIPPTGEHDSRTLAVTTIAAPVPVQHHPPPTLEVTTVGSAPSSSGLALSPHTSHLALAPSSPVFANQSPVGLAARTHLWLLILKSRRDLNEYPHRWRQHVRRKRWRQCVQFMQLVSCQHPQRKQVSCRLPPRRQIPCRMAIVVLRSQPVKWL
nr:hypothetical protein Itr_chr07CG09340 [Ipomoea trifida]